MCCQTRLPVHISVPLSCVPPITAPVSGDEEIDWNSVIWRS